MAYTGNEVITLEFGHYSNFIGTHWWNSQEASFEYSPESTSEINHDVLFREGQTHRGEVTFTPRLLLVDLKGSLGSLPKGGRLYETPTAPDTSLPLWPSDRVVVQSKSLEPKNEFQLDLEHVESSAAATHLPKGLKQKGIAAPKLYNLDNSINSWSDYLRPHLHPRSINLVKNYQRDSTSHPFDTFSQGQEAWKQPCFNEEYTDSVRLYMEETDNLQGFQILMDNFDGFSGLGCAGIQYLKEEYPSKTVLCFSCQPPQPRTESSRKQDSVRLINQSLCMSLLAEHSNLFVPISGASEAWRDLGAPLTLPHVVYKPDLYYHSSALVASAVDSLSLLYRLRSVPERLCDLTARLSMFGRVAAVASLRLPFTLQPGAMLLDTLEGWEGPLTTPLVPLTDLQAAMWQQTLVLRGVPESRLMRPEQINSNPSNPAYSSRSLAQLIKTYLLFEQTAGHTQTTVLTADSPFNTHAPFPHIFAKQITTDGQLDQKLRAEYLGVESVPVMAGLHSCQSIGSLLEKLHTEAKKVNVKSLHQFVNAGLESLELDESLEQLLCLSECYSDKNTDF